MAAIARQSAAVGTAEASASASAQQQEGGGLSRYYQSKLDELELIIREKTNNLRRLEAQRNALNTKGSTAGLHDFEFGRAPGSIR